MEPVGCVVGLFVLLGLACVLWPERVADLGVRLDTLSQRHSREILARYPRVTRWSGRIAGGILILAGLLIFFASRP